MQSFERYFAISWNTYNHYDTTKANFVVQETLQLGPNVFMTSL